MAYGLRVVPQRKRRSPGNGASRKNRATRADHIWLDFPSVKDELFESFAPRVRSGLEEISLPEEYPKGTTLFFEGEQPVGVYVLHAGRVKLSANSADGRSLLVGIAECGEIVGLPPAISGKASEVTAEVVENLQCDFISRDAFLRFLRKHGPGALRVAEMLTEIYHATLNQVRHLGFSSSTSEKLARFLLDLPHAPSRSKDPQRPVRLTHGEIAGMIGSSRETVTRMVARFKREQLVRIDGSVLRILDREGLQRMVAH